LLSDAPPLTPSPFGFDTFSFEAKLLSDWDASIHEYNDYMNVLRTDNTNLRASQKELLQWHHRPSHYNLATVRLLVTIQTSLPFILTPFFLQKSTIEMVLVTSLIYDRLR
jgi:hypothetical protein